MEPFPVSFRGARAVAAIAFWGAAGALEASACDICAVFTATEIRESRVGPYAGAAEQLTRFTKLRRDGDRVGNAANERLESSISQVVLGYGLTPRLALQANVPVVHRSFRRAADEGTDRGTESGVGDVSFLGRHHLWTRIAGESLVRVSVFAGVEAPTGDSDRLGEELGARHEHEHGNEADEPEPHGHASGVHGHDLALGSGSWDGLFGGQMFGSWRRAFLTGSVHYGVRTAGDFGYDYANELAWSGGPGALVGVRHDALLGLQAVFSGETKGRDRFRGDAVDDTAITSVYAGPGLLLTWGASLGAEAAADLPLVQNVSGLQIVPSYRIRGGFTWRF